MILPAAEQPGALVISLDFELAWGVREKVARGEYLDELRGARDVVPRLLGLFEEFEVAATWAVVGCLFAADRAELMRYRPAILPSYRDASLDPYRDVPGQDELRDPLRYASSLIDLIRSTPRQEIATHTFSHLYCMEPGVTADAFRADLHAAGEIARSRGIGIRSIVLPRNQYNPNFDDVLIESGIQAYRGNPRSWLWSNPRETGSALRLARLADAHIGVTGSRNFDWSAVRQRNGLADVRASHFLRPVSRSPVLTRARFDRIAADIREAARARRIVHLWFHPHNFGAMPRENLENLRCLLQVFDDCRSAHAMTSLAMAGVAERTAALPVAA